MESKIENNYPFKTALLIKNYLEIYLPKYLNTLQQKLQCSVQRNFKRPKYIMSISCL